MEPHQRPAFGVIALGIGAVAFTAYFLLIRSRPWLSAGPALIGIVGIGIASGFLSPLIGIVPGLLLALTMPYQVLQTQRARLASTESDDARVAS
ncbi:hypothetical protein EON77_05395 [bacterium]|nr:MAG: hypothetical protein EON77_05395 [bacterium]